ncbi:hypothetical protein KNE206_53100 [Kitasatospora sp. NE20-6]
MRDQIAGEAAVDLGQARAAASQAHLDVGYAVGEADDVQGLLGDGSGQGKERVVPGLLTVGRWAELLAGDGNGDGAAPDGGTLNADLRPVEVLLYQDAHRPVAHSRSPAARAARRGQWEDPSLLRRG